MKQIRYELTSTGNRNYYVITTHNVCSYAIFKFKSSKQQMIRFISFVDWFLLKDNKRLLEDLEQLEISNCEVLSTIERLKRRPIIEFIRSGITFGVCSLIDFITDSDYWHPGFVILGLVSIIALNVSYLNVADHFHTLTLIKYNLELCGTLFSLRIFLPMFFRAVRFVFGLSKTLCIELLTKI